MNFTIFSDVRPPTAIVTAAGELDVFTSRELRDHLQEAVDRGCHDVLLDLDGVTFADASALRVISLFRRQLVDVDGSLQLIAWSPRVERLCQVAGIDRGLRLTDATSI